MKGKMSILISFVLIGILCLLVLSGCSRMRNFVKKTLSLNSYEKIYGLNDKDVAKFVGKIRFYQENPDSIYQRALYFQERKKHKLAVEEFRKILRIDSHHVKAYNGMGVSYDSLGEFANANQSYKSALALNPNLDYALNNLGCSSFLQGDLDSAIEYFKSAIALNNQVRRYHNNLGLAYARKGLHDLAFQEFKLAGGFLKARNDINEIDFKKGTLDLVGKDSETGSNTDTLKNRNGSTSLTTNAPQGNQQEDNTREGLTGVWPTSRPNSKSIGLNGLDIRTSRIASHDSNSNLEKNDDRLRRGFRVKAGSDRQSSGNADLIEALESHSSGEQTPFVNNGRVQTSAYPFAVDSWIPTLNKIEKGPTYEEVGAMTDQRSSHHTLDRVFLVGQRDDRDVEIEISNGNGVRHMARRVGGYLKEKGYQVTRLTNAQHFHFADTTIYYCNGHLQDAYQVAREIPGWNEMTKVANLGRSSIKVKVQIGKDLVPYDSLFRGKGLDGDFPRPLKIANLSPDGR